MFNKYNNEDNELLTINLKIDSWDIYYISLCIFEKLINNYSRLTKEFLKNDSFFHLLIFKSLKHPHVFIKSSSLRLIGYILAEQINNPTGFTNFVKNLIYNSEDNLLNTLLFNLRYIILKKDSSDKLVHQAIKNSLCLIDNLIKNSDEKNNFSFYATDFINQLYSESKSFVSNDEISDIIFKRIFLIIEAICTKYKSVVIEMFFEPIMSMVYRILTNVLVSEDLKNLATNVII